jgi:hypothetical protein
LRGSLIPGEAVPLILILIIHGKREMRLLIISLKGMDTVTQHFWGLSVLSGGNQLSGSLEKSTDCQKKK